MARFVRRLVPGRFVRLLRSCPARPWLLVSRGVAQRSAPVRCPASSSTKPARSIAGARVTVSDDGGVVVQTTTTDAAGAFALRGLAPGTLHRRSSR